MNRINISKGLGGVPHRVYDLSIQNIEERKAKSIPFNSAKEVASFLGVKDDTVFNNRKPGKRIKSPVFNRQFAVRIESDKKSNQ